MSPLGTFLNGSTATHLSGATWLSLSETAQRGTKTITPDGAGGGTTTWNYAGTIPCRFDNPSEHEELSAERVADRAIHTVYLPGFEPIEVDDRLSITGRGTFEVLAVDQKTAEVFRSIEVLTVD